METQLRYCVRMKAVTLLRIKKKWIENDNIRQKHSNLYRLSLNSLTLVLFSVSMPHVAHVKCLIKLTILLICCANSALFCDCLRWNSFCLIRRATFYSKLTFFLYVQQIVNFVTWNSGSQLHCNSMLSKSGSRNQNFMRR